MKEKKRWFPTVVLLLVLAGVSVTGLLAENMAKTPSSSSPFTQTNTNTRSVKNWTVMLYFCADTREHNVTSNPNNSENFLHEALAETFVSLRTHDLLPGAESDLNVIVLYDYPYSLGYPHGHARLFSIWGNGYDLLEEWGETNMGSYVTLRNFIDYTKTHFPANNYALVLSDHGRGYAGFCYDYHAPHPYYKYALGDCLTVGEIRTALVATGGVDVLFLNTCSGGSFEVMWELAGLVDFAVAGESMQSSIALYHPRDVLYTLSRDTAMTPLELAQEGFNKAREPIRYPSEIGASHWRSVAVYDLRKILSGTSPSGGTIHFKELFKNFTSVLLMELNRNLTKGRELFGQIRNECTQLAFKTESMMVDLGYFIERTLAHADEFYDQNNLVNYGNSLLFYLFESQSSKIVLNEFHHNSPYNENLTGFSICLPNTADIYQEYLYPLAYESLNIATETDWEEFFYLLHNDPAIYLKLPIRDFYEVKIGPIDPSISLHIFINEPYMDEPMHIGYSSFEKNPLTMGIEMGVPEAEFIDSLILGTCTIRIPTTSLPKNRNDNPNIKVTVDARAAVSATLPVNLTARHVINDEITWEGTQVKDIKIGQVLSCEISTEEDNWTTLIIEKDNNKEAKTILGIAISSTAGGTAILLSVVLITIKKKKKTTRTKKKS